jgi:hypothetical protein
MTHKNKIDWREHYRLALFEADPDRVLMRIEVAHESVDIRERSQLDSAAYFLGSLRTIVQRKQKADGLFCSSFDAGKQPS